MGKEKVRNMFSTIQILLMLTQGVGAILWRAYFLDYFGQDHEFGDPGLLNRMI